MLKETTKIYQKLPSEHKIPKDQMNHTNVAGTLEGFHILVSPILFYHLCVKLLFHPSVVSISITTFLRPQAHILTTMCTRTGQITA